MGMLEAKKVRGIFTNDKLNIEKLAKLTNEEFSEELQEDFNRMKQNEQVATQCVRRSGVNSLGDTYDLYEISIGNPVFSHHYTFVPSKNHWYKTVINQDYYKNVVEPF
ncbi:hypothetical protein LC087_16005 [Bacillus carboniphilus]|uniref:Uncharacterized protein n=1 Tax=Bacillus carboniphilus TaxID=86663 RepID=A0ABY9JUQ6_9BACI|nr:hypothetical protein [Bacillus carboniphilus]WLR42223.1 hypothetical protein LC087_16005 [Bacillus carboniphilus]